MKRQYSTVLKDPLLKLFLISLEKSLNATYNF